MSRFDPCGAVRVGGNVRPPVKLVDIRPVRPEMAERADVRGLVIVEVTIDVDGTVKDARVLRSIPILDAAALEAVGSGATSQRSSMANPCGSS